MKPEQIERIRRHGETLLKLFSNTREQNPLTLYKQLRRMELTASKHTTLLCNGDTPARMAASEKALKYLHGRVTALLGDSIFPIHINRDPRGYALKIDSDNENWQKWKRTYASSPEYLLASDWGGYGLIAPVIE